MDTRANERIDRRTSERGWPDYVALAFGIVYLAVGALGFTVTDNVEFADNEGALLLDVFRVNPLHNIVHLGIGLALVGAYMAGRRAVITMAGIIGATYLLVGVVGPFLDGESNILALNGADHALHLASGLVLVVTAVAGTRERRTSPAGTLHNP
jgi:hypothetical protein